MKIVTIGGGTGQFTLLSALKKIEDIEISSIVSMVDSGGSTGRLRDEYGVLPPGDILKCLIALSPYADAREILQTRFESPKLKNHNAGNMLLV
ncbi:YvcK family protein, partial [Patescibacteria group bacterium]|nr:YvcK family protein [Patescibacteria group bacterium]